MEAKELQAIAKYLSQIPFFSEVSVDSLIRLCDNLQTEDYGPGELIFEKGEEGDRMYVILRGKVRVFEGRHVYGFLAKGDCFGEYALIDDNQRSASVETEKETLLLPIERKHFLELMSADSGLAKGILSIMIHRHRTLDVIQERLADSKHQLEVINARIGGLINGVMDAILMFDANFRIQLSNPSAETLLENKDVVQRNLLYFLDDDSAALIRELVGSGMNETGRALRKYLPKPIKVIGSEEKETWNEGTISMYTDEGKRYYILVLRNIEARLKAEDTIELLTTRAAYLEEELKDLTEDHGILAEDESMMQVLEHIQQVARTDATVLITGETGTGKELVARAIHRASLRKDHPLIRINCGAIPANLIESELFGHEKGAFTGATSSRKGRFLLADKGTIFLDEIGELPLELQPKLLRVLQEGEFEPVGSSATVKVDVRIIAATHRDLLKRSAEGEFREDLYYRLNVFPVQVPPLRDRGTDLLLIAREMLKEYCKKLNKPKLEFNREDLKLLQSYHWPGNVRELQNIIERGVIVARNGKVRWQDLIPAPERNGSAVATPVADRILSHDELQKLEKENILKALKQTSWKVSGPNGAAALLKIPPTTLASKMKALGISRPV